VADTGLSISTLVPETDANNGLKVDGVYYPYANRYNWSLLDRARWDKRRRRLQDLEALDEPTEADAQEWTRIVDELVQMAVPTVPAEQVEKLTLEERALVYLDFLARNPPLRNVYIASQLAAAETKAAAQEPAGSTSFPASRRSTAGLPPRAG
jgi:hypothetical protein